jgi:hypothetical protein
MVLCEIAIDGNWPRWFNGADPRLDAANITPFYYLSDSPFDSRLYAGVYDKFFSAARDGSAEWGMNLIQWKQAASMLVKYTILAADLTSHIANTYKRGWRYLNRHPQLTPKRISRARRLAQQRWARSKNDRRLKLELRILNEASAAVLAYQYGVAPVMSDIASTAKILSEEPKETVEIRKTAFKGWGGRWGDLNYLGSLLLEAKGTERCTLRGTCSVSNPNLLLANRLGITNPQLWLWDATPWSFVVDWWLPVGTFLSNFTSSLGLSVTECSITRTRDAHGTAVMRMMSTTSYDEGPNGRTSYTMKRKERTTGPLPQPFSVPYGSGLGVERARNAYALIMQLFLKR